MTEEMIPVIERYLSYGWRWGVFTGLINRQFNTDYKPRELERLYKEFMRNANQSD